jgi:hypothetical protein
MNAVVNPICVDLEVSETVEQFDISVSEVINTPIPDGYIQPIGTITATKNGTLDVSQYASADISVPDNFAFAGGKYF